MLCWGRPFWLKRVWRFQLCLLSTLQNSKKSDTFVYEHLYSLCWQFKSNCDLILRFLYSICIVCDHEEGDDAREEESLMGQGNKYQDLCMILNFSTCFFVTARPSDSWIVIDCVGLDIKSINRSFARSQRRDASHRLTDEKSCIYFNIKVGAQDRNTASSVISHTMPGNINTATQLGRSDIMLMRGPGSITSNSSPRGTVTASMHSGQDGTISAVESVGKKWLKVTGAPIYTTDPGWGVSDNISTPSRIAGKLTQKKSFFSILVYGMFYSTSRVSIELRSCSAESDRG